MKVYEKYLKESGKYTVDGKYINMDGDYTSIPDYDGDIALVFRVSGDEFLVKYNDAKGKQIYAFTDKYDKTFKDIKEFVKWLNKNNAEWIGVDDYI